MLAEQSILDRIQRGQLKWYGHPLRMEGSHWSKKTYQWTPHGRRRGGRTKHTLNAGHEMQPMEETMTILRMLSFGK